MSEDKKTIEELKSELEQSRMMCDRLRESNRREVAQIYDSLSWRITAPLRYLGGFMMNGGGDSIGYLPLKSRKALIHKYGKASFPDGNTINEQRRASEQLEYKPVFSILVPLYNTPKQYLKEMIQSVLDQSYPFWELCLADASDKDHGYVQDIVRRYSESDSVKGQRILYKKLDDNYGISGNTNECLSMASGDYIGLFDHDDLLHPELLFEYAKAINSENSDFLYCDELTFKGNNINQIVTLHLKPDYSKYTLLSNNYICHFSAFRKSMLNEGEGFNSEYDGSQDYDMILRMTSRAKTITHIDKVLYYWRSHSGSTAGGIGAKNYAIGAGRKVLENYIGNTFKSDFYVNSVFIRDTIYRTRYSINGNPKVLVIADSQVSVKYIAENTLYNNCHIECGTSIEDDNLEQISQGYDYIAFVKGEVCDISKDWIEQLLMFCQMDDVGIVGGLAHDNGNIVDAGIAFNSSGKGDVAKLYNGKSIDELGYMARLTYVHELSGFMGLFCMCKTKLFVDNGKEIISENGLIELCYQMENSGLHNIFTPFATVNTKIAGYPGDNNIGNIQPKEKFYSAGLFDAEIFEVQ